MAEKQSPHNTPGWMTDEVLTDLAQQPVGSESADMAEEILWLRAVVQAGIEQLGIDAFRRAGFFQDEGVPEVERLSKLVERWKAEAERFEGMWRMECDLAASRSDNRKPT